MKNSIFVCGECDAFVNEDAFGNGWCVKYNKECFTENGACKQIARRGSRLEQASEMYAIQRGAYDAGFGIETSLSFETGARWQRNETRQHAVEVCKQMCPSKNSRGCANLLHKRETKTTRCDGNCTRVKYFINELDKQEL